MRVLQISKFYRPIMGGIETVTWELTEGLNRAGIETDVLCSNQQSLSCRERFNGGYEVMRASSLGMLLSTSMAPAMIWHLRRLKSRYDMIHMHMPDPMAALALWAIRPRVPVVVHWHSDVIRQRVALKAYEPLQRWMLQRADAIVATSRAYADASMPLRPWLDKVTVIPIGVSDNGCAEHREQAAVIRQRYLPRKHLVFSLGRMTYYKGYEVLIDAAALLPDDMSLLIGGDGELLEHYRAMVLKRGLGGKVDFLGHVSDGELPGYFAACDVFCMPSTVRAEAYGVTMVEAMMMGKPIVATDIVGSGVPWVNQHGFTGLNVPVRQPQAMADALTRLLCDDELRQQLGGAARARYLREFGAERMTQNVIALYDTLLSGARLIDAAPRGL